MARSSKRRIGRLAVVALPLPLGIDVLHDQRGRGERKAGPDDHAGAQVQAMQVRCGGQRGAGGQHLDHAAAEDRPAQLPQPGGAELQPYDEEEQHDAEFGEVQQLFGVR